MRIALALVALAPALLAQSLQEKLDAKLQEPFAKNCAWVLDYDDALAQAKASGKLILGYFTRSYAP
jgi:hypothetical protein